MPNTSVTVYFGEERNTFPVVRYETHAAFSKHTVNVLDLRTGVSLGSFPEWTPVRVDLTSGPTTDRWYGYVHHSGAVDDTRSADVSKQVTRYTLIGTSLPLNEERTRSWHNMTRSAVVRDVARQHHLRTMVQVDNAIQTYIAQAACSDMALLQQLATESGYRLWVDGSTLRFFDPDTLLLGARLADIRRFTKNSTGASTCISWKSKAGSMVPRGGVSGGNHVAYGLTQRSRSLLTTTSDTTPDSLPSLTKIDTSRVLTTAGQAAGQVRANSKNTRAWVTATAVVPLAPDLRPGDVIEMAGDRIKESERGLWLVTDVSHRVLNDGSAPGFEYLTTLQLERDGIYSPTFRTSFRTINTREVVAARMRNGSIWEAAVMEDIRIG